jgi:hypothetical protein
VPSAVTDVDAGVGPVFTPEPASVAVQLTVTLVLFQPAPFGAGVCDPVTVGAVPSTT